MQEVKWKCEKMLELLFYRSSSGELAVRGKSRKSYTLNYHHLVRNICMKSVKNSSVNSIKSSLLEVLHFIKQNFYNQMEDVLVSEDAIFVESVPWYACEHNSTQFTANAYEHALPDIKSDEVFVHPNKADEVFLRRLKFHSFSGYPSFTRQAVVGGEEDINNESQCIGMCSSGMTGFIEQAPKDHLHLAFDVSGHMKALHESILKLKELKNENFTYKFKKNYSIRGIPLHAGRIWVSIGSTKPDDDQGSEIVNHDLSRALKNATKRDHGGKTWFEKHFGKNEVDVFFRKSFNFNSYIRTEIESSVIYFKPFNIHDQLDILHEEFKMFVNELLEHINEIKISSEYENILETCRQKKNTIIQNHCSSVYISSRDMHIHWTDVHSMQVTGKEYNESDENLTFTRSEKDQAEGDILAQVVAFGGHLRLYYIIELYLIKLQRIIHNQESNDHLKLQKSIAKKDGIDHQLTSQLAPHRAKNSKPKLATLVKSKNDQSSVSLESDLSNMSITSSEKTEYFDKRQALKSKKIDDQISVEIYKFEEEKEKVHLQFQEGTYVWVYGNPAEYPLYKFFPIRREWVSKEWEISQSYMTGKAAKQQSFLTYRIPVKVRITNLDWSLTRGPSSHRAPKFTRKIEYEYTHKGHLISKTFEDKEALEFITKMSPYCFDTLTKVEEYVKKICPYSPGQMVQLKNSFDVRIHPDLFSVDHSRETFWFTGINISEEETNMHEMVTVDIMFTNQFNSNFEHISFCPFDLVIEPTSKIEQNFKSLSNEARKAFNKDMIVIFRQKSGYDLALPFTVQNDENLYYNYNASDKKMVPLKFESFCKDEFYMTFSLYNAENYKIDLGYFYFQSKNLLPITYERLTKLERSELSGICDASLLLKNNSQCMFHDFDEGTLSSMTFKATLNAYVKLTGTTVSIDNISILLTPTYSGTVLNDLPLGKILPLKNLIGSVEDRFENFTELSSTSYQRMWESRKKGIVHILSGPLKWIKSDHSLYKNWEMLAAKGQKVQYGKVIDTYDMDYVLPEHRKMYYPHLELVKDTEVKIFMMKAIKAFNDKKLNDASAHLLLVYSLLWPLDNERKQLFVESQKDIPFRETFLSENVDLPSVFDDDMINIFRVLSKEENEV